jgi:voltage-gated potassium channel
MIGLLARTIRRTWDFLVLLKKEKLHRIFFILLVSVGILGVVCWAVEIRTPDAVIRNIWDGIWWGFVTIFTVGYGDRYPVTVAGRIVGIVAMFLGLAFTVMFSATMASIFVDRKLKEGKGLQKVELNNHIIICGWNEGAHRMLEGLQKKAGAGREGLKVVLVNELEIDTLNEVQFTYATKTLTIEIVRGNFTHDQVLEKAGIAKAKSVVILADAAGAGTGQNADERTILACYAISNAYPGVSLSVELLNAQNEQYLKNTKVENVIITGEFNSFLLVNSAISAGIPRAAKEMLSLDMANALVSDRVPDEFVGRKFADLFEYFRTREKRMLVGLVAESRKLSIDDFLSDDPSAIDEFIKRKFAESEKDYFADTRGMANVMLNPGWEHVISANDRALLIGLPEGSR